MGITNRGKWLMGEWTFRGSALPANFYVALMTAAGTPSATTDTFGQLTQIGTGSGYVTGGYSLSRNTTDFDSHIENDTSGRDELQIKDVPWTASGGTIPLTGAGARWAILTTDEVTIANRNVIAWWDLLSDRSVLDGQILRLVDLELRGEEPA